ncbi:MAG: hypothetical protein WC860_08700 [Candidatus Margulisiibacteriota bacterium]|jgi:predicted NBD/HSP70 family sugar kinase
MNNLETLEKRWKKNLQNPELKPGILSLDIGGTKISYALIPINAQGNMLNKFVFSNKKTTHKGKENLIKIVLNIINEALQKAEKQGYSLLPVITAGSPGRYIGQNHEIIAKGSAANLANFLGEFDNCNLGAMFQEHLPQWCTIIVKNDAIAQFSAGLTTMLENPTFKQLFSKQKVAYIGPGTGLGGGFAEVDEHGYITFFTDGHIYDCLIPNQNGQFAGAEDLFSGRAFEELTKRSAKEVNSDPELIRLFTHEIELMGTYLAELIEAIYIGSIKKKNPEDDWPKEDINGVKKIKYYLIGGSLGTIGRMGEIIRQTAQKELEKRHLFDIKIFPIEEAQDAALFGAAHFVFADVICKMMQDFREVK